MSLPDISPYQSWIYLILGLIGGAAAGVTIYSKLKKKKPDVVLKLNKAFWHLRQPTSIVTDIYVSLLLQNKGDATTTINTPILTVEHEGQTYGPINGGLDNIELIPGASIPKQFEFHLSRDTVVIDSIIERATIRVSTTHGESKELQVRDIKQE